MHADPTRLITFRDFLDCDQGLECWCPGCRRTAKTDVAMLVKGGLGDRQVEAVSAALPQVRQCGHLEFHRSGADAAVAC